MNKQLALWEAEHKHPNVFPFLESDEPHQGVVKFYGWLRRIVGEKAALVGLDVCCGKGRNAIWLASHGIQMAGFDFSQIAIDAANTRVNTIAPIDAEKTVHFFIHDANKPWPFAPSTFDFVIDCFGSCELESLKAFSSFLDEANRVLKPGGYCLIMIDSPDLGFFANRIKDAPGPNENTIFFPNGKIELLLTDKDISNWDYALEIVAVESIIDDTLEICGLLEPFKYHWIVARSPEK